MSKEHPRKPRENWNAQLLPGYAVIATGQRPQPYAQHAELLNDPSFVRAARLSLEAGCMDMGISVEHVLVHQVRRLRKTVRQEEKRGMVRPWYAQGLRYFEALLADYQNDPDAFRHRRN